jgi:hypothetical protein
MDENTPSNPADAEGKGESGLVRPEKPRGDLRLLRRAILRGWQIPESIYESLPRVVIGVLTNATTAREKLAAVKLLTTMHKDNVDTFAIADRAERLDEGMATERIELKPITFERRD